MSNACFCFHPSSAGMNSLAALVQLGVSMFLSLQNSKKFYFDYVKNSNFGGFTWFVWFTEHTWLSSVCAEMAFPKNVETSKCRQKRDTEG